MFSPETLDKMNRDFEKTSRDLVTYCSQEVLECRARCNKRCCINCESFLSAEISASYRGMLLDLVCGFHYDNSIDARVGTNQCTKYKRP